MKSNELVSGAGLNFSCTGLSEDGVLHLAVMDKDIKLTPKQISFIRDKELRISDAYVGRLRVSNKQEDIVWQTSGLEPIFCVVTHTMWDDEAIVQGFINWLDNKIEGK